VTTCAGSPSTAAPTSICYPVGMDARHSEEAIVEAARALETLRTEVSDCNRCGLCKGRTNLVFGVGSATADLMFVGEAPGFNEDRQGEPFVGQAGRLLTELISEIGLQRSDVYITNVVKCRPPENRDPSPEEIAACSPHLLDQVGLIRPAVICTLGRFAARLLADTELSMTAIHGKAKRTRVAGVETLIFPVFHPAAALYQRTNRQVLEEDFEKLRYLVAQASCREGAPPQSPMGTAVSAQSAHDEPAKNAGTRQLHLW